MKRLFDKLVLLIIPCLIISGACSHNEVANYRRNPAQGIDEAQACASLFYQNSIQEKRNEIQGGDFRQVDENRLLSLSAQEHYARIQYLLDRPIEPTELADLNDRAIMVEKRAKDINWITLNRAASTDPQKKALLDGFLLKLEGRSKVSNTLRGAEDETYPKNRAEQNKNWRQADEIVRDWAVDKQDLSLNRIKMLHSVLANHLANTSYPAGEFRRIGHEVGGGSPEKMYMPSALVENALADFMLWYEQKKQILHPVHLAGEAYQRLVSIHPFPDANGRTSRLVRDWVLQLNGYPPSGGRHGFPEDSLVAVFGRLSDKANISPGKAFLSAILGLEEILDVVEAKEPAK